MSEITDVVSATGSAVSAAAACVAAVGVWYARKQLKSSKEIAQLQFEDALDKEYRVLAKQLPKKALLGDVLTDEEYEASFDELFCYVDLSNEQVSLRQRDRISLEVWGSWREGIQANLAFPAFARAWAEIKQRSTSFRELRRLEGEQFQSDPKEWHEP